MSGRLLIPLLAGALTALPATGQTAAPAPVPAPNPVSIPVPNPPSTIPPVPPARKAPTDLFRELLAASPARREALLAQRPEATRELILFKLREFEALPPDQRELRLRVAELQFYLTPLLRAAPEGRTGLLASAPAEVRPLLEDRLRAWDSIPADRRRDILDSAPSLGVFVRLQAADPASLTNALQAVPAHQRAEVEAQFARWTRLTPEERARKTSEFQRFFELRPGEQQKVLRRLSTAERTQMERTLEQFHQLPDGKRDQAVRGFRRFMEMSPEERAGFLQNAAKWQAMTPSERDAWRRVVERVTHPVPLPMPPGRTRGREVVMTNSVGR